MSQERGGKSRRGRFNKNKNQVNLGDRSREVVEGISEDHPVIKQFKEYAAELDKKHDRYERLIKISRDITIESKRIIFLLHTVDKETKKDVVLSESEKRLNTLINTLFKKIAEELDGEDPYQFLRAYKPGLQEFIEAITFYWYLQNNMLYGWENIAKSMNYELDPVESTNTSDLNNESQETDKKMIYTLLPPVDYILGIADLTGELMRKCISNLATGDISSCYQTCNFVRCIYKGFLSCTGISGREVYRKLYTLKQSLTKMENVCYTIKVRGSEIPKHMLADVAIEAAENIPMDDDEGYQAF